MNADSSAMDPRPLPPGWMTQWNERYRTWFYINTNVNPPASVWEHPSDMAEAGPVRVPVSRSSEIDLSTRGSVSGSAHANEVFDDDHAGVAVRRREDYDVVSDDFFGNLDGVAGHHLPLLRVEFEHHPSTLATHPPSMMRPFEPGATAGAHYCYVLDHPDLYELSPYQLVRVQQAAALYQQQQQQSSLQQQEPRGFLSTSISGSSPTTTTAIPRPVAPPAPHGHLSYPSIWPLAFQPQQHHPLDGGGSILSMHPLNRMDPVHSFNHAHLRHHHDSLTGQFVPRPFGGNFNGGGD
ncbi:hypothetical protein MVLG_00466 [Microbotryum lychnidis-dioicae p1A1 Lamole]|uniref:WW domain-containing protein n=1 Tax=Microbotryum lychnidis-dioicae (strain p1A1 Lamole / MvSl-1064) TaxID=683840 RepID=U5GZ62_USTV1|nr:hypothetical protein MVLG_00466 [Microbotryum lychnidis-dioicae p1A1 Lamole]|eukprot:KDE09571.1 hypothetical protein MVLG_00466 [Microbotryum lychnidis-dioicae p1A1 Lamole]